MTFENGCSIFHFITCAGILLLMTNSNCERSIELDYEQENNSSSYDYEEESTVERLSHGPESEELQEANNPIVMKSSIINNIRPSGNHKMVPLFDKDGKHVKSYEVYDELRREKIEKMYYDSEGKRVTIPILLREEDFQEANLTKIVDWIEWIDDMRATILDMKEKASSCTPQTHEVAKGYDSVSVMLKDIEDALKTLDKCENKLNNELRDPAKQWNYPSEKQSKVR